jgi:hypothetical protein
MSMSWPQLGQFDVVLPSAAIEFHDLCECQRSRAPYTAIGKVLIQMNHALRVVSLRPNA